MNILVTLNSGLGADTGPNFNLTADVGSVTPSTATKAELLSGKFVDVDPSATQITVTSTGVCTTSIVLTISGQTTTTTTATPLSHTLGYDVSDFFAACIDYGVSSSTFYSSTSLGVGVTLYTNQSLSTVADDGYYSNGTTWWRVRFGAGYIASTGSCSTTTTTSTTSTSTTSTTQAPTSTTTSTSTTTTLAPIAVNLGYDASIGWQACYAATSVYYIAADEILENTTFIYTDSSLTTKPIDGYYSNGANYWYSTDGELSGETPCPTTTTTSTTSTTTTSTSTSTTTSTTTAAPTTTTTTQATTTTTTEGPTTTTTTQPGDTTTTTTTQATTTTTEAPTTTTTTEAPTTTTTTTAAPQCNYDGLTVVCDSTTTTTTAAPTTTTTTAAATTTTTSGTQLFIYAKYINSNGNLQYQINSGPIEQLGTLSSTCDYVTTIAVTVGDEITFTDVNSKTIASSTSACPDGPGGFACSVGYSVLIPGSQSVYLTIDGNNIC